MLATRQDEPPLGGEALGAQNQERGTTLGPLAYGRVDLWHVYADKVNAERLAGCRRLLSAEEAAQADRFFFEKDRRLYLVARAMLRTVLSGCLKCDPRGLVFRRNGYGKPFLAGPAGSPLQFNLSHSGGLAVCAVTLDHEIGVDVEDRERRVEELELARRFFAPAEAGALEPLPAVVRRDAFFRYWTLKEAYIKARGMGLSMPLESFIVSFGNGRAPAISFADPRSDRPEEWQLAEFRLGERHQVALAVRCPSSRPLNIAVREMPL